MDPNDVMKRAESAIERSEFHLAKRHLNEVISYIRDEHGPSAVWSCFPKATDLLIREWCMEVRPMTVFHGTSFWAGEALMKSIPHVAERSYAKGMKGFSCTSDFHVAEGFGFRQSPQGVLEGDYSEGGVVIEYILCPAVEHFTFLNVKDRQSMRDEKEILVLDPTKLIIQAVHRMTGDGWQRQAVEVMVHA
jgi:hypothetical protein